MDDPLARKLSVFIDLDAGDLAAMQSLYISTQTMRAGFDVIHEGDRPESLYLLVRGWGMRYKSRPDGTRQILAYLIPGDICDHQVFLLEAMDHTIGLLSDAVVAMVPKAVILDIMATRPNVSQALWWSSLVDQAILREWLFNLGSRPALEAIAHLFCEMWLRLKLIGHADSTSFSLPVTQTELAETIGITPVHVNRVLRQMQAKGLIALSHKRMTVTDLPALRAISEFDPAYLHLERRSD